MSIEHNTLVWWLIITLTLVVILGFYLFNYHFLGLRKCIRGIKAYYAYEREQHTEETEGLFSNFSAKAIRELAWLVIVVVISAITILYVCNIGQTQDWVKNILDSLHDNFTDKFPLITTIIGAFIALICDYLFIHPKLYVSPDAYICPEEDGSERLTWYVENRGMFDCIDVHIDAYKYYHEEKTGDAVLEPIEIKKADMSVMAGRWAKSNDRSVAFSTSTITKKSLKESRINYIIIYVKVTHALSRVTKTIIRRYQLSDIYVGDMQGNTNKLHAFKNPRATISSLKSDMLKRFMYSRKFESICMAGMFCLFLAKIIFPNLKLITYGWADALIVAFALSTILFAMLRFFYHLPVLTEENDENKLYRAISEDN